jgi:FAD/FMN-containing dehydrogenase
LNTTRLSAAPLSALRRDLQGDIILPADAGYDDVRTDYNTTHHRWPAVVVRAADVADVAATVRFAAEEGLMLAVRGGNHSMRGHGSCDDGVVLDLGRLRTVEVDAAARTAHVAGGATWADVNGATHEHGLATTGGLISTTGVGGLTLGGGIGYLTRRLGLACDNVTAAELVTARGEVLAVDSEHAPDLLWALRGGGGNFGVVTSFTFRLAPVAHVLAGPLVFELEADVVARFDAAIRSAPRELGAILGLTVAPPLPAVPAERHGTPCAVVVMCWTGDADGGRRALREIEGIGTLLGKAVGEMPYPVVNTLFDALLPAGLRHYWKSHFIDRITPAAADAYVAYGATTPTPESGVFFYPTDGAAHDVGTDDSAWAHRSARFLVGYHGSWKDPAQDESIRSWVRDAHAACAATALTGSYVNFASDDETPPGEGFGQHAERLVEIKRRYDAHNLFCLNANIDPDAPAMSWGAV